MYAGFSFRVNSPFHASHGVFMPSGTTKATESKSMDSDALSMDTVSEASPESVSVMANDALAVGNFTKNFECHFHFSRFFLNLSLVHKLILQLRVSKNSKMLIGTDMN